MTRVHPLTAMALITATMAGGCSAWNRTFYRGAPCNAAVSGSCHTPAAVPVTGPATGADIPPAISVPQTVPQTAPSAVPQDAVIQPFGTPSVPTTVVPPLITPVVPTPTGPIEAIPIN